jgi:hypothetical protein
MGRWSGNHNVFRLGIQRLLCDIWYLSPHPRMNGGCGRIVRYFFFCSNHELSIAPEASYLSDSTASRPLIDRIDVAFPIRACYSRLLQIFPVDALELPQYEPDGLARQIGLAVYAGLYLL